MVSCRQALLVSFVNNGTAFFAGFVIFSLIGNMAYVQRKPISSVASSGPGLAFLVYPSGVAQMWLAPVWATSGSYACINILFGRLYCT